MPYKRKDNSSKPWTGQIMVDGKARRQSFATKKEAIEWEVEQRKRVVSLTPTVSLGEWAVRYLDFAKSRFAATTYGEKVTVFKRFFHTFHQGKAVDSLTPGDVLAFLKRQNDKRSGNSANKDRKNLAAAWSWGVKYVNGFPQSKPNPCLVEKFPEKRLRRYVPPEKDFWAAYDACLNDQDRVMLLTYLHLAARRSELFRLKWEDVDFAGSRVRLYTRKTKDGSWEEAWLPMTADLQDALLFLKQERQSSQWVFVDPDTGQPFQYRIHWMHTLCKRAGVKYFGVHGIRHLTASILAKGGVAMIDIQTILRHKNLATTERYIRRIESLRPALHVLPKPQNHRSYHRRVQPAINEKRESAVND